MPNFGKIRPAIVERSKSCAVMGVHNRSYNNREGVLERKRGSLIISDLVLCIYPGIACSAGLFNL